MFLEHICLNSEYCGYYCVLIVLFKCKKRSFLNFLNHFDQDTFINDKQIKKLIEQFINKNFNLIYKLFLAFLFPH
jgi:hypothetical protein